MKIKYLNGNRLYHAVLAGGNAVIEDQVYLNKINVFPVPDADTGTNLASTMFSIAEKATADYSFKTTLQSIANAALSGARGNSGLIFAQFLLGMSQEFKAGVKASTKSFGESAWNATQYAYNAILSPVEGTMVTVIKDWARAVYEKKDQTADFVELFSHALNVANQSLKDTPKKLKVLAKAGVVDAGAKGFVDFLEGIIYFIKSGQIKGLVKPRINFSAGEVHFYSDRSDIKQRFCTEALIDGKNIDLDRLREEIRDIGESAIVAGNGERARIHIHTNRPGDLFTRLHDYGDISQVKVDDMVNQYEISHNAKSKIALVTDSACDIPVDILEDYQIQMIPLSLMFGKSQFLDKVTIQPEMFYTKLSQSRVNPTTALPPPETVRNLYSFLLTHFDSIISIHLSDQLSGTYQACVSAAESIDPKRISVLNSKSLSIGLGMVVYRAAKAIREGKRHEEVVAAARNWIKNSFVMVDVRTLKYFIRGGRVSPLKGLIAKLLKIKPIIILDKNGKVTDMGKSISRAANKKKIIRRVKQFAKQNPTLEYTIVHAQDLARAELYSNILERELGKKPVYITDVAPVIGVHAGVGALAVAVLPE